MHKVDRATIMRYSIFSLLLPKGEKSSFSGGTHEHAEGQSLESKAQRSHLVAGVGRLCLHVHH